LNCQTTDNPVSLEDVHKTDPFKSVINNMKLLYLLLILLTFAPFGLQADDKTSPNPATKTLVWPDGTRYVGGVKEGKRKGRGTIFWQDGTRFVGQFENDMRNGPGTMTLPDGTVYTGLFENDGLVDTEPTIAGRKKPEAGLDNDESAAALKGTELPMEADSLGDKPPPTFTQVDKNDVREPESKPELTIIMANAAELDEKIAATAETSSISIVQPKPSPDSIPSEGRGPYSSAVTEITDSVKDELIETVDQWAAAWSEQNAPKYIAKYSEDFVAPDKQSRRNWEASRKKRVMRPTNINLDIRYQRFELVETDVVDVFFRQAYRSNTYSDLTDKVIRLRKEQKDWKILVERSM
jgi:ketosteroid isomerase-like protein